MTPGGLREIQAEANEMSLGAHVRAYFYPHAGAALRAAENLVELNWHSPEEGRDTLSSDVIAAALPGWKFVRDIQLDLSYNLNFQQDGFSKIGEALSKW